MNKNNRYLYLLSFLEGGAVMICELIGAKMLAPYFGTSLYVWAAALGLTLGGLTTGYFLGGRLSGSYPKNEKVLHTVLILAGFFLFLMPFSSSWIMGLMLDLPLQTGAIISLLFFMVPPLVGMGMVSPLIIGLLTEDSQKAGNKAGNVYAISTLGGILATFLMGFFIIPEYGLKHPAIIAGIGLAILPVISLTLNRNKIALLGLLFAGTLLTGMIPQEKQKTNFNLLYNSEGILGQVKVVDHPSIEFTQPARMGRGLIVNNTLQTFVGLDHDFQFSIWEWSHYFPTAASIFPEGSDALILGMGGGTISKQFDRLGFKTDIVEIDARIRDISYEYFGVPRSTEVIIDDARHYVKVSKRKYDIVVYDTFLSESVPEHLLTVEGFEDVRQILKPDGMVMINFYGFIDGPAGVAARSVLRTLDESGFNIHLLPTPGTEDSRNLIFIASDAEKDFSNISYEEPNTEPIKDLYTKFIELSEIDFSDGEVLSDNKPKLSKLYGPAAMRWKRSYNGYYRRNFPELLK